MLNITRKATYDDVAESNIRLGDQIKIPVKGFGTFMATAEKMAGDSILFIFDDIVARKPMNETNTNEGGFKESQLYKWLQDTLLPAFPEQLRSMISELTIPTVGQIVGHSDDWDNEYFEGDGDEQLPLMKDRKHRIALFEDDFSWYWVRNATRKEYSSATFAGVNANGNAFFSSASDSCGVRPAFWLVKNKFRGPVPRSGRVSYKSYSNRRGEATKESLIEEINEKAREIDVLKKEIEKLEKKDEYNEAATEIKAIMNGFIHAGFSDDQAFDMAKSMLITVLGGMR